MSHPRQGIQRAGDLFKTQAFINAQWITTTRTFAVTNPATDEMLASVSNLDASHALVAIDAAHNALPAWRDRPAQ